jgi:drug/metabolite transporter (DMT)-like permease
VPALSPTRLGIVFTLASGVAFAVQPVLGQLALDRGTSLAGLLGWRYALAAVVLAVLARSGLGAMSLRTAAFAFALGVVLYAADAAFFYAALERTSAPFATLLHYAHLVVVVGAAALLGRERLDARRAAALVGVLLGVVLVSGGGTADAAGIVLALAAALAYAGYVLVADRLLRDTEPMAFAALLTGGAATAFLAFGSVTGDVVRVGGAFGLVSVACGALIGSVFALSAFLAGIRLVGPSTASLLVTVEVPAGLLFAALALGERLTVPQLAGAALVVVAIALLQLRIQLLRARLAEVRPLPVSPSGKPVEAQAAWATRDGRILDRRDGPVPDDRPTAVVPGRHAATPSPTGCASRPRVTSTREARAAMCFATRSPSRPAPRTSIDENEWRKSMPTK